MAQMDSSVMNTYTTDSAGVLSVLYAWDQAAYLDHLAQVDPTLQCENSANIGYIELTAIDIPADFDGDGDVDGVDFFTWQTGYPTASGTTKATGDTDGDGDVDGVDFLTWQTWYPHP